FEAVIARVAIEDKAVTEMLKDREQKYDEVVTTASAPFNKTVASSPKKSGRFGLSLFS
ncbi:unnamed protein product, partial [Mesorhabditis spiculigera]